MQRIPITYKYFKSSLGFALGALNPTYGEFIECWVLPNLCNIVGWVEAAKAEAQQKAAFSEANHKEIKIYEPIV